MNFSIGSSECELDVSQIRKHESLIVELRSSGDPYIGIPIYTCDISKEEEDS